MLIGFSGLALLALWRCQSGKSGLRGFAGVSWSVLGRVRSDHHSVAVCARTCADIRSCRLRMRTCGTTSGYRFRLIFLNAEANLGGKMKANG